ncbi:MAG: radical SAM protein [Gemmatimonadota bacterium]
MTPTKLHRRIRSTRRRIRAVRRRFREARLVALAFKSDHHPVLAHVVPIRRCNLSCAYCNEFDKHSAPVPLDEMLRRIDRLAELGTTAVHLSGGEPLLHPDLDEIVRRIRERGMLAGLLTNGYLLTRQRIERLNDAGLDQLQISVDNVTPDEVSKKSLKILDRKIRLLAEHALFDVNLNSVLGSGVERPEDALAVARRARELDFTGTVGIIHDGTGRAKPLSEGERAIWSEIRSLQPKRFWSFARYEDEFQENLVAGRPNRWRCGAGGRYLYICEDGLVHWCSQQRGIPAIPLAEYSQEDLDRESRTSKPCAPFCTVSCVHRVSVLDRFRERPLETIVATLSPSGEGGSLAEVPLPVRAMAWMFVRSSNARFFKRVAMRALGVG